MDGYSVLRMTAWGLLALSPVFAQVNLRPFPQKFVTRFASGDAAAQHAYGREVRLKGGVTWSAGSDHVLRLDPRAEGWQKRQYFGGQRYLAPGDVAGLWHDAKAAHETVWVKTTGGVTRIELKPMTLGAKAALFEERVRARHDRYGFTADS
ncbi:MAG: hypothetical protein MUC42_09935, partial [Bryobacter sp.]|nr:hypothetical protein [Bryobacter sp.]